MGDMRTCDLSLIGQRLTELREKSGLTQDVLSEKIGVSRQAVSQWENGVKEMGLHNAVALCKALDCDLLYLVYGDDSNGYNDRKKEIAGNVTGFSPTALDNLINLDQYFFSSSKYADILPFEDENDTLINDSSPLSILKGLLNNNAADFAIILSHIGDVIRTYSRLLKYFNESYINAKVQIEAENELKKIVNPPDNFDECGYLKSAMVMIRSRLNETKRHFDNEYKITAFNFSRVVLERLENIAANWTDSNNEPFA